MDPQQSLESLPQRILQLKGKQSTAAFSRFLGVGVSTLHNYEKGRVPPLEFLLLLAQKTGASLQWLLTGEGSVYREDSSETANNAVATSILVVDDKEYQRESLVNLLEAEGYRCVQAGNLAEARERLQSENVDIVVTDLRMPNEDDGLVLLKEINEQYTGTLTIIVTVHAATARTAVEAIRLGAIDYLVMSKNFPDELRGAVGRARDQIRREAARKSQGDHDLGFGPIVGTTPAMQRSIEMMRRAISSPGTPVLILGEPGTGKELFAKTIHQYDADRCKRAFVPIKCGSMDAEELRFELLGGTRVVDGRAQSAPGVFSIADAGTVFLDEIDTISPVVQVALTRLLEEGVVAPVGGGEPKPVNVRLIGASHNDVDSMAEQGVFRRELLSALTVTIHLPSLASRQGDLPHLAREFLAEEGGEGYTLEPSAIPRLSAVHFPDNLRGLRTLLQRAVLMADTQLIGAEIIEAAMASGQQVPAP